MTEKLKKTIIKKTNRSINKTMGSTSKNQSIKSLNPLLGFGWSTNTKAKKEMLVKRMNNAFKTELNIT
ncbi:hypothetical protein C1H87_02880 [Flavivirga eckloniae]|uniref:Uncharacterized protein n=1 Tax=Flavivirga eckloniae TaxID=1803846 RepID=A0A2K9PKX4_9FLAO|nr:hypothetical protein C1H87_02880 [Flavivirga eckloniae]